jgi:hypothetical protein
VQYDVRGNDSVIVSPYDWLLTDSSGSPYGAIQVTDPTGLPQLQLIPGQRLRGLVWFEVPATVQGGLVLNFNAEVGYETAMVRLN